MAERPELEGIDPIFYPRLKLFLSADIIGSTAYKQPLDMSKDDPEAHAKWAGIIQGFYKEIFDKFREHRQDAILLLRNEESIDLLLGPAPRFWKTIGDEVVFWKELTNSLQVWLTLSAWMKTIASVRNYFAGKSDEAARRLDIKSTAWVAGFPVRNKAILGVASTPTPEMSLVEHLRRFYVDKDDRVVADFIGPGIDVGFRISSFASSRKLAISLDLAYILAMTRVEFEKKENNLPIDPKQFLPSGDGLLAGGFLERFGIHYSGSEQLKGVLGGIDYPEFWISTVRRGSLEESRVALYTKDHGQIVSWGKLQTFCDRFYVDRSQYLSKPFIMEDKLIGDAPERYWDFLRAAAVPTEEAAEDFQI